MKLRTKIVLLATVPAVFLGLLLCTIAAIKIQDAIFNEAYIGMHATTLAVNNIFETASEGEYHVDDSGILWKGDANISEAEDIVDRIKSSTGMDVTIFYGNTRYLTTIVDDSGNRQVGTTASEKVTKAVLDQGKDYQDDNVDILGTRYICYYIPIMSEADSNKPIGMIFLGQKYATVRNQFLETQKEMANWTIIELVFVVVIAIFVTMKIVRALTEGIGTVQQLADGKLGIPVNQKLLARKDVIGDMCRGIEDLDEKLTAIIKQIQTQCAELDKTANGCTDMAENVIPLEFRRQRFRKRMMHLRLWKVEFRNL